MSKTIKLEAADLAAVKATHFEALDSKRRGEDAMRAFEDIRRENARRQVRFQ